LAAARSHHVPQAEDPGYEVLGTSGDTFSAAYDFPTRGWSEDGRQVPGRTTGSICQQPRFAMMRLRAVAEQTQDRAVAADRHAAVVRSEKIAYGPSGAP